LPKHSARQFTTARLILGFAAAVLVALVGWVAVRAGGPAAADEPVIVQPPARQAVESAVAASVTSAPSVAASPSPSPSASLSRSPSPSPSPSRKKSPSPSKSSKVPTSPSPSPSPSPAGSLQVTYATGSAWRDGFTAGVRVVNNGSAARDFTVTISYASGTDLRIRGDWNASVSADGNRVTVRGGPLAPGASVTAGFQVTKGDDDSAKASGCTVVGGTCTVS
jgi:hypothetical protein